jgi:hypothetical protein
MTTGAVVFCAALNHLVWTEPMGRFTTVVNKVIHLESAARLLKGKSFGMQVAQLVGEGAMG